MKRRRFGLRVIVTVLAALAASISIAQAPRESEKPPVTTDVPPPRDETPPPVAEICADQNASRAVIDRIHSRLYRLTCSSASWFDGLFGNTRYDEDYRATNGSLTAGTLWSERKSWQEVLRFRAKV